MMRKWMVTGAGLLWIALGIGTGTGKLWAAPQAANTQAKPTYTLAEYNAYKAADAQQNPQQKIKLLDQFVKTYPISTLMPYVYRDYYLTDYALKNFSGTIEYADKMVGLGDKVDTQGQLEAYVARAQAYYVGSGTDKSLQTPDAQTKARDAAVQGLKTMDEWKKPAAMTQDNYDKQVKGFKVLFNSIAAMTSTSLKDYAQAANYYKTVLSLDPTDAISHFRLGVVYLQMTPPQADDGFWELARSIGLKSPNGPNAQQVKTYLKNQIIRYQQPACDNLVDNQVNQLITLASTTDIRPATMTIPSAADLQKARDDTANFLPALEGGGDAGNVMWLASCGLEYPDVGVRVMADPVVDGDNITFMVFRGSTPEAIEAATAPNMQVTVVGQPEAARVAKDAVVRFTGTLVGYTQNPFMLTWNKAKINPEDIPAEKGSARKKAPARKAPAK
ncbi:MAG TPA: tetratricopeptide repeat protein [Candidatus Dormibacteraeota bacterium]|nr:tetratricopeptide repeat protein [Candidatus Dormibacteraeota bacterium]